MGCVREVGSENEAHPERPRRAGAGRGRRRTPRKPASRGTGVGPPDRPGHRRPPLVQEQVPDAAFPRAPLLHRREGRHPLGHLRSASWATPILWPQIWDQNKYITRRPLDLPRRPPDPAPRSSLVTDQAGEAGAVGTGEERAKPRRRARAEPARASAGAALYPVTEEIDAAVRRLHRPRPRGREPPASSAPSRAPTKVAFAERDILYLEQGQQRRRSRPATSTRSITPPTR